MARLQVDIVTAEGRIFAGDTDSVTAPGIEGQLTILPSHAPLITSLDDGDLKFTDGPDEHHIALLGGFMEVNANKVTILANSAEDESVIDIDRAEEAMRRARQRLSEHSGDVDVERALASIRRAQVRITVARKRRGRGGSSRPAGQPGTSANS